MKKIIMIASVASMLVLCKPLFAEEVETVVDA